MSPAERRVHNETARSHTALYRIGGGLARRNAKEHQGNPAREK